MYFRGTPWSSLLNVNACDSEQVKIEVDGKTYINGATFGRGHTGL